MVLNYIILKITGAEWLLVVPLGAIQLFIIVMVIAHAIASIQEKFQKKSKNENGRLKVKNCSNPQCRCANLPLDAKYCPKCGQKL